MFRSHGRIPRAGRVLRMKTRITGLVTLITALLFIWLHSASRQALEAKFAPTNFSTTLIVAGPDGDILLRRQHLVAAKSQWRRLGSGYEGTVFAWENLVVKTFHTTSSPFRNCFEASDGRRNLQATFDARWPTEIPAILALGNVDGVLPAVDFFLDVASTVSPPQWHLVTPLVPGGTLLDLAKRVRAAGALNTTSAIDMRYRPSLNRLLATLNSVHNRGLCHDDVKPDNIFIKDDADWLLGDLGNVREVSHSYHSSTLWRLNSQLPDCRANDVLRLLKTYIRFLRAASDDDAAFSTTFMEGQHPWSRLFWRTAEAETAVNASQVLQWSPHDEPAEMPPHTFSKYDATARLPQRWFGRKAALQAAIAQALKIQLSEGLAKPLALTAWLGIPLTSCSI